MSLSSGTSGGKALNRYGYTVTQEKGRSRKNITQICDEREGRARKSK